MKSLICLCLALTFVACSTVAPGTARDPGTAAEKFYSTLRANKVDGLPEGNAWRELKPLMSPALVSAVRDAQRQQRVFIEKNPDVKPPWIEGDLFGSLFEGPQDFRVGLAMVHGDVAEVPVHLSYSSNGNTVRWADTLILRRTARGWLVDDVRFGGKWPFANTGTLQDVLTSEGC